MFIRPIDAMLLGLRVESVGENVQVYIYKDGDCVGVAKKRQKENCEKRKDFLLGRGLL